MCVPRCFIRTVACLCVFCPQPRNVYRVGTWQPGSAKLDHCPAYLRQRAFFSIYLPSSFIGDRNLNFSSSVVRFHVRKYINLEPKTLAFMYFGLVREVFFQDLFSKCFRFGRNLTPARPRVKGLYDNGLPLAPAQGDSRRLRQGVSLPEGYNPGR